MLYYTVLYYTILYYTILYYTTLIPILILILYYTTGIITLSPLDVRTHGATTSGSEVVSPSPRKAMIATVASTSGEIANAHRAGSGAYNCPNAACIFRARVILSFQQTTFQK